MHKYKFCTTHYISFIIVQDSYQSHEFYLFLNCNSVLSSLRKVDTYSRLVVSCDNCKNSKYVKNDYLELHFKDVKRYRLQENLYMNLLGSANVVN